MIGTVTFLWMICLGMGDVPVVRLADLEQRFAAGSDTVYVVNFWATWCKPCVAELPHFDKLSRSVKGQAVRVLLVSLDDPDELTSKVEPFIRRKGYSADVVLLDEAKPHEWIDKVDATWSGAIPATWLVHQKSGRRQFHEREFDYNTLEAIVSTFVKGS